ncbi:39S ribosomal protein L33, mitochondrial [Toxorhynchites rutilus septentrionalis]|uniref:39S ribosomal protein L33, mitochondrial n=1 Tax=Toxorhynchites rutilus septentrionalis TaxID=329112 RepID=UPI002478C690|nr:39S ribosomal protein L33, mitochondrial [Toxorhynchites rutilus septentrionalis]
MFLTNILLKKVKSKNILVLMESAVSGHQFTWIRERLADKIEMIRFDPYIQRNSLYRERRRVRSLN